MSEKNGNGSKTGSGRFRDKSHGRDASRAVKPHGGGPRPGGASRDGGPRALRISARDAALRALQDVVRGDAFAGQALDRRLEEARLKPDDRRLAAGLFYSAVENRLYIEYMLGRFLQQKPEPVVNDILHIAAAQLLFMDRVPDHAAVDEAVKQARAARREGFTGLVNGVLRSLIRARDEGTRAGGGRALRRVDAAPPRADRASEPAADGRPRLRGVAGRPEAGLAQGRRSGRLHHTRRGQPGGARGLPTGPVLDPGPERDAGGPGGRGKARHAHTGRLRGSRRQDLPDGRADGRVRPGFRLGYARPPRGADSRGGAAAGA